MEDGASAPVCRAPEQLHTCSGPTSSSPGLSDKHVQQRRLEQKISHISPEVITLSGVTLSGRPTLTTLFKIAHIPGRLGGSAVERLPLARHDPRVESRIRLPAWSLLLPLPVSLRLSLSLFCVSHE